MKKVLLAILIAYVLSVLIAPAVLAGQPPGMDPLQLRVIGVEIDTNNPPPTLIGGAVSDPGPLSYIEIRMRDGSNWQIIPGTPGGLQQIP